MIVSASRRTDIPNYYIPWLKERVKERLVYTRNPINASQVSKIVLTPETVDCIVFWSKNPRNFLSELPVFQPFRFYLQFTLNSYKSDMEPHLPPWEERVKTFQELSARIGTDRVLWRYDPVLLKEPYSVGYHLNRFQKTAEALSGYTEVCTISFLDIYLKKEKSLNAQGILKPDHAEEDTLVEGFSQIAASVGMELRTCAEKRDFSSFGVMPAHCIDKDLIEKITGRSFTAKKDRAQRPECGCIKSIDIGAYNTCLTGCGYCYANYSMRSASAHFRQHNPLSPFLSEGPFPAEHI